MNSLEEALYCGLSERDFWDMTLDEIMRYKLNYAKKREEQRKEILCYLHILGNFVGLSNARNHFKGARYPSVEQMYPNVFGYDENAANFLNWANAYEARHRKEAQ